MMANKAAKASSRNSYACFTMQLIAKSLAGNSLALDVTPSTFVENFKFMIAAR
ncbi:hypothetical protein BD408DRAFT_409906 [Parasitella parasitica]|nr:hypothetical protein BD408DRAFT_409906 [Parasitella parasitica]